MAAGVRLCESPDTGDINEDESKLRSFQLLGMLGFHHFCLHVNFASSNQRATFPEGAIEASVLSEGDARSPLHAHLPGGTCWAMLIRPYLTGTNLYLFKQADRRTSTGDFLPWTRDPFRIW